MAVSIKETGLTTTVEDQLGVEVEEDLVSNNSQRVTSGYTVVYRSK